MKVNLNHKFWLEDSEKFYGQGPHELLKKIDSCGSITEAAKLMNLSYAKANKLIKRAENHLGFKLINRTIGGNTGGGSALTANAIRWIDRYDDFLKTSSRYVDIIWENMLRKSFYDLLIHDIVQPNSDKTTLISIIGGGGKTMLMDTLFQMLANDDVLYTTTTHVMVPEFCNVYFEEELMVGSGAIFESTIDLKAEGVSVERLNTLKELNQWDHILVESDGSRNLPFKVYAKHEPPLSQMSDVVVIVIGCDAFVKPSQEAVHRAKLIGLKPDETLSITRALDYLRTDYLPIIPPKSRLFILFNKYTTYGLPVHMAQVSELVKSFNRPVTVATVEMYDRICYHHFEVTND